MARMPRRRVLHDSALVGLQFMQGAPTWTSPEPSLGPRLTVEFEDGRIVFAHLSAGTAQTLARAAEIGEEMPCSSSASSIRNALRVASQDGHGPIERVRYGLYRLRRGPQASPPSDRSRRHGYKPDGPP